MNIEEIKEKLKAKAVYFITGGIRPTNEIGESWIGKVTFENEGEQYPYDELGNKMIPLFTLFLNNLEYVPESLKEFQLITIFVSTQSLRHTHDEDLFKWFHFRMYKDISNIVSCEYVSEEITPFPLVPKFVDNDYPSYDDLEGDILHAVVELEDREGIDYYDICENEYDCHKLGKYPHSIQGGVGYPEGYEFVLQICSDDKAGFNIIDSGNFYFAYNKELNKWLVRCDYY